MKSFADYTAAAAAAPTLAAKREIYAKQFLYVDQCAVEATEGLAVGQVVTDGEGFTYTVVSVGPKMVTATYYGNYIKAEYGYKKRFKKYEFINNWAVQIAESLRPVTVTAADVAVVVTLAAQLEAMVTDGTLAPSEPAPRKPGPAKGSPVVGGRQPAAHTVPQSVLATNWHLFPAAHRPTSQAMAAAMGCGRDVLRRKMSEGGRGFTPAQLLAGQALLDQHRPPNWPAPPAQASAYTDPA